MTYQGMEFRNGVLTSNTSEKMLKEIERLARRIIRVSDDPSVIADAQQILTEVGNLK